MLAREEDSEIDDEPEEMAGSIPVEEFTDLVKTDVEKI